MLFGVLLLFALFALSSAAQRSSPIQIPMASQVHLNLGEKPQRYRAQLSTSFAELIVIDVLCGMQISECSRYCEESFFGEMYCKLMCQLNTGHSAKLICTTGSGPQYDSTDKGDRLEWHTRIPGMRALSGFELDETVQLIDAIGKKSKQSFGISFISATLFDSRLIRQDNAVFGLRPGPNSIIEQIFKAFGLKSQKITLCYVAPIYSLKSPPLELTTLLTIGSGDPVRCGPWSWTPALSNNSWSFVADVEFLGTLFKSVEIVLNFGDGYIILPTDATDQLLQLRILRPTQFRILMKTYRIIRSPQNAVKFSSSGYEFLRLTDRTLLFNEVKMGEGVSAFVSDPMDPHSTQRGDFPVWTMGTAILEEYCVGFDYAKHMVGFARRRRFPAFPFLYDGMTDFERRVPKWRTS